MPVWPIFVLPLLIFFGIAAIFGPRLYAQMRDEQRRRDEARSDAQLNAILRREIEMMKKQRK